MTGTTPFTRYGHTPLLIALAVIVAAYLVGAISRSRTP
jgi:apolipoprotein N-acyltransferase